MKFYISIFHKFVIYIPLVWGHKFRIFQDT